MSTLPRDTVELVLCGEDCRRISPRSELRGLGATHGIADRGLLSQCTAHRLSQPIRLGQPAAAALPPLPRFRTCREEDYGSAAAESGDEGNGSRLCGATRERL